MRPSVDALSGGAGLASETIQRLRALPLFAALDGDSLACLLEGASLQAHGRDDVLFRQGETADGFYIMLRGRVALRLLDRNGRESIIEVVKPGDTFGEEAVFDRGRFSFGARAIEEARTVRVPAGAFLKALANDFKIVRLMMASMSAHLQCLVRQVGELKLKTTEQRLANYLLSLVPDRGGPATIVLPYDKKVLASELGMSPESLSRALARLKTLGLRASGGVYECEDVGRLRAFCNEADFAD